MEGHPDIEDGQLGGIRVTCDTSVIMVAGQKIALGRM
jgi:hypothetical protein